MRADLVRVHSGEAPEAPKVFTDAERTSLLSSTPPQHRTEPVDPVARPEPDYTETERGGSVGRWLIAVAVLAVLTVVVTVAINMFGGGTRDVQGPDVRGQLEKDAIAVLQNAGFKTRTQRNPDSTAAPHQVLKTKPQANSSIAAGHGIRPTLSPGPAERQ